MKRRLTEKIVAKIGVKVPPSAPVKPNPADPENNIVPKNHTMKIALEDESGLPKLKVKIPATSPALSTVKTAGPSLETRKIAVLVSNGVAAKPLRARRSSFWAGKNSTAFGSAKRP